MGAKLAALLELQNIELQIFDIRRQLGSRQRLVARQTEKVRAAEHALEAERHEMKRAQVAVDESDLELKAKDGNIGRLREQLNSVRTNKEYAAVLSQLNTEKADRTRLETRAYELMSSVETRRTALTAHEQALQQERDRLGLLERQLEDTRRTFSDRLSGLEKQRSGAAEVLEREALDLFNRVSERYDGEAMARVARVNPRRDEFICEGCNMGIAVDRANLLLTQDKVITCDNCGRILYIERGE